MNWDIEGRDLITTEWVSLSRKFKNNEEKEVESEVEGEGRGDRRIVNNRKIIKKCEGKGNGEGERGLPTLVSQKSFVTYKLNSEGIYHLLIQYHFHHRRILYLIIYLFLFIYLFIYSFSLFFVFCSLFFIFYFTFRFLNFSRLYPFQFEIQDKHLVRSD